MSVRVAVLGSGVAGAGAAIAPAAGGAEVVVVDSVLTGQATAAGAGIIPDAALEEAAAKG